MVADEDRRTLTQDAKDVNSPNKRCSELPAPRVRGACSVQGHRLLISKLDPWCCLELVAKLVLWKFLLPKMLC